MTMVMTVRRCGVTLAMLAMMACPSEAPELTSAPAGTSPAADAPSNPVVEVVPSPSSVDSAVVAPATAAPVQAVAQPPARPAPEAEDVASVPGTTRYAVVHTANLVGELEPCG
jgi:hypothetical protein